MKNFVSRIFDVACMVAIVVIYFATLPIYYNFLESE